MKSESPSSSNDAIAGSEADDGVAGLTLKSVFTLTFWVAKAYRASEGKNVPPSSVDDGATVRLTAPRMVTNS